MPVTLVTIKNALKIDYTADDAELQRILDAATDFVESYTGILLDTKKKTQYCSYWMKTRLVHSPFVSIDSVRYTNTSGVVTTMPSTDYFLIRSEEPTIYINFSELPSIKDGTEIQINYTAGYASVPPQIEQLLIALVGAWYNNPEVTSPISLQVVPMSAQFVLENLREKGTLS
jgi:uncharacterized phiE125 gp8 family phage protein